MRATEILSHEHGVMLRVVAAAEREVTSILHTGRVHGAQLAVMVEFFTRFDDDCHEPKERDLVFRRLCRHGMAFDSGLLGDLLREHESGRIRLRAVRDWLPAAIAGEPAAVSSLAYNLAGYCELVREHIAKEERELFAAVEALLDADEQSALAGEFVEAECDELESGVQRQLFGLARELTKTA
jgi:hemerythrin-like domain-containing protein